MLQHFRRDDRKGKVDCVSAMHRMLYRAALLLCIVAVLPTMPQALAQALDPVQLKVVPSQGYGRMVLTFSDRTLLPNYDAVVTGGVLRISFEEPIDVAVDDVPLELGDYIAIARRDPDGSAIRFALKSQFKINTLEAGEKLFIDILPSNWQGLPPGLPDDVVRELAKRAETALRKVRALEQARLKAKEGPSVILRIGEQPTFTRLVFDWSIRFDTAFVREDDIIKLTFNHPAQLDISDLRAHLPQGVVDATSFLDKGKLKFLMRIDPSVDIRAFRENQTYVIDITPENKTALDSANAHINEEFSTGQDGSRQNLIVAPGVRNTDEEAGPPQAEIEPQPQPQATAGSAAPAASAVNEAPQMSAEAAAFGMVPFDGSAPAAVAEPDSPGPSEPTASPAQEANGSPSTEPVEALPSEQQNVAVADAGGDMPRPKPVNGEGPAAVGENVAAAATSPQTDVTAASPPEAEPMPVPAVNASGNDLTSTIPPPDPGQNIPPPMSLGGDVSGGQPPVAQVLPPQPAAPAAVPAALEQVEEQSFTPGSLQVTPPAVVLEENTDGASAWRAKGGAPVVIENSPEQPPADFADEARNFVSAEARRIGNSVRIVFPFLEPVSSAIFRRNDNIWMVFDTDATIDTRGMASALSETAKNIVAEEHGDYQVLRLDLNDPVLATVGLDGNSWSLVIGEMILEPSIPLRLERNVRGDGGSVLRVLYKDPQNIREITDPFVGDKISLVTGFGPPRGLLKRQRFVDLEALSSAQGVAFALKSDGVTVKILGDDIIIEKIGGLSLSSKHQKGSSGAFKSNTDPDEQGNVEFVSLATSGPKSFREELQKLQLNLSKAAIGERRKPLMALARFYLAHQFAQEAMGLLSLAAEEDPAIIEDSAFNLMMGAAKTLSNRPDEAYDHLNRRELKSNPDAAVWQTIVDVALANWTAARIAIPRGRAVVGNYPKSIQAEFNLAAAQAMVEVNDFGVANSILAEVEPSEVSSSQAARYDILRGRVADASGRSQEALRAYDLVSKSGDRPRAAEADYRALRIRYRDGEIDISEAIDQLSALSTYWRGDEIELKTLRFLAQLHAETGQYREAFEAMKSAVQADPQADTTRLLQEEMNALFATLFLDGKADEMRPIKALALYYDFREMTPIGRRGDEMVRGLAKRLVEVDLLDQAAELLRHQVDNRLKGSARAQIAADLGAIYLIDRKPEQALRVLNQTRQASLPSTLERQRNIVEARALTASGRPDLALELVRNMRGSDVDRLRADTFWAAQSWREAGEELEAMHGSRWSDNIPLDDLERRDILRAGIAYSLAGDQLSLNRLQTKYLPKMADSPESLAFEVVTRPIESQGVEFLEVANRLASTDELDTFMEEYRRQYMTPRNSPDQAATDADKAVNNG
ncbi:tetratricopeptide repeat protein [Roseibium algae]|uniref:Tetratricopeptide repeat protein n=1 Tax=Roseibium algae TaxID=3123038 RepID=A0ABU8TND4_9HYPH